MKRKQTESEHKKRGSKSKINRTRVDDSQKLRIFRDNKQMPTENENKNDGAENGKDTKDAKKIIYVEDLYKTPKAQQRAKRIYFYRVWGYGAQDIAKIENIAVSTVWKYFHQIRKADAVISAPHEVPEMIKTFLDRIESLIQYAYTNLLNTHNERMKIQWIKVLLDLEIKKADSVWRSSKTEHIPDDDSALKIFREKIDTIVEEVKKETE